MAKADIWGLLIPSRLMETRRGLSATCPPTELGALVTTCLQDYWLQSSKLAISSEIRATKRMRPTGKFVRGGMFESSAVTGINPCVAEELGHDGM